MSRRNGGSNARTLYVFLLLLTIVSFGTLLLLFPSLRSWLVIYLGTMNVITFLVYAYDKGVAGSERTRVSEGALLLLALIGGTVGALLAMITLHHKTVKMTFRAKFLGVFLLQEVALLAVIWLTLSGS